MDHKAQYLSIKEEVDAAMRRVIEGGVYILNDDVTSFEQEFADYCGAQYGVSVHCGLDAIRSALLALGIGKGDKVITVDNGCPSVPLAIAHTGATPVFLDIDERTYNMNPKGLESEITPQTKAVIAIHSYGQPCDIDRIKAIAHKHGLVFIEDFSLAVGARYDGRRVGGFGDVSVASLSKGKILTSFGNGAGMILTNDEHVAERAKMYSRYGFRTLQNSDKIDPAFKREGGLVCAVEGYNSHLDALQAAVLRIKLRHMDEWATLRLERAKLYDRLLAGADIVRPYIIDRAVSVYRGYTIRVQRRYEILDGLRSRGVEAMMLFLPPLHLQPVWGRLGYHQGDFPVAEKVASEVLSLPLYPEMTEADVEEATAALESCLSSTT
jgi:dTDP-4-amino-4,6-dideoxygalactose transaminase